MNLKNEIQRIKKGFRAVRFYRQCVHPGELCFDIGANKGSRAMIFTLLGARTIALEPNIALTRWLRRFPRVTVVNKAVSSQPGRRKFFMNINDQISSLNPDWCAKWPEFPDWSEQEVECVTLDQVIAEYGLPDFCKVDVEGYEPAVLSGLTAPIPRLSFEVSPDFPENTRACVSQLMKLGDYHFNFSIGDNFAWFAPHWVGSEEIIDLCKGDVGDIYAQLRALNK